MAYKNAVLYRYQVQSSSDPDVWIDCRWAQVSPQGWLDYTLPDGTVGLKRPGTWRVKPPPRSFAALRRERLLREAVKAVNL